LPRGIDVLRPPEASHQQGGRDEQHDGERDLGHEQRAQSRLCESSDLRAPCSQRRMEIEP
jgi:hypothetical protein